MKVARVYKETYELEDMEIAKGSEGRIHKVIGSPNLVAKIYEKGILSRERENRLIYMVKNPPGERSLSKTAWPKDILFDENGRICGFVMSKVGNTVSLRTLGKHSRTISGKISTKYKMVIARNICSVLWKLHIEGYVFCDMNPENIGVDPETGEVVLFDMDSCQTTGSYKGAVLKHYMKELFFKNHRRNHILNGPVYTNPVMIVLRVHNLLVEKGTAENCAKEMKDILDGYEIPCIVVEGFAKNQENGLEEPHAWVLAYINARWRHIDPVFDGRISSSMYIREDYFQLTDTQIAKDHRWDREKYPQAD